MIPPLPINGTLPPGVHQATLAELFRAYPPIKQQRTILNDSLQCVVPALLQLDPSILIFIDGSYVTRKAESNDVDLLIITPRYTEPKLEAFLDQTCPVEAISLDVNAEPQMPNRLFDFFTTTRKGQAKGIVQIV